jgi:hypothetical protein
MLIAVAETIKSQDNSPANPVKAMPAHWESFLR